MTSIAPIKLAPFRVAGYAGSGATPRTFNIQLPTYGVFLVDFIAWYGNANTSIDRPAIVTWFGLDASGAQENWVRATRPIGEAVASVGGAANLLTGLSMSAPTTTGLITVTVDFSGGGSINPRVIAKGIPVASTQDFSA